MKHILKYKIFFENLEFEDSDNVDVRMSKEKLNDIKSKITEYNSNKSKLENIYKNSDNLQKDLENLLGKESEDRNEFLVSYSSVLSLKKKIESLQKKGDEKAIEISDFKKRLQIATDNESKKNLSLKINDLNNDLSKINQDINDNSKKLPELEKQHKEKMSNIENDIKEWIEKIS